jgi:hypothetical protein
LTLTRMWAPAVELESENKLLDCSDTRRRILVTTQRSQVWLRKHFLRTTSKRKKLPNFHSIQ